MKGDGRVIDLEAAPSCGQEDEYTGRKVRRVLWLIVRAYLSITYSEPFAASCAEKPSSGGSSVTETLSSLWRRTGGMSAKDAGVDALMVLCSSGEMCVGSDETSAIAILYVGRG